MGVQVQSPTDKSPAVFVKSQNERLLRANNSAGIDVLIGTITLGRNGVGTGIAVDPGHAPK